MIFKFYILLLLHISGDFYFQTNKIANNKEFNYNPTNAVDSEQCKEKSKNKENISVGLFTYPILMASDILLYSADLVPTGVDQKQHVELARDLAIRFNNKFGETFKVPEPMIPEVGAKIKDLQDPTKKMSKSSDNPKGIIFLLDDDEVIRKKIMSAVTDSEGKVYYDEDNKPGISNLLTIYSFFKKITIKETEEYFKDYNYGNLKKEVADIVIESLGKIKDKYYELIDSDIIDKKLDEDYIKINNEAKEKYEEVRNKLGLGR